MSFKIIFMDDLRAILLDHMKEVNVDKLKYGFQSRDKKHLYIKNCGATNRISD